MKISLAWHTRGILRGCLRNDERGPFHGKTRENYVYIYIVLYIKRREKYTYKLARLSSTITTIKCDIVSVLWHSLFHFSFLFTPHLIHTFKIVFIYTKLSSSLVVSLHGKSKVNMYIYIYIFATLLSLSFFVLNCTQFYISTSKLTRGCYIKLGWNIQYFLTRNIYTMFYVQHLSWNILE